MAMTNGKKLKNFVKRFAKENGRQPTMADARRFLDGRPPIKEEKCLSLNSNDGN